MSRADIVNSDKVSLFNLRGDQNPQVSFVQKAFRVLLYYIRLIKYAARSDSKLFHIQWFNKFLLFDRTLLNLYYKFLGKRLVFTAHNIDEQQRDGNKNILNQLSLKILYNLVDHIFVHTIKMKEELIQDFNIKVNKVTVIPFGINNTLPRTHSTRADARNALGLQDYHKILLFFGNIAPYKGLEDLVTAAVHLRERDDSYRVIIAGQVKNCRSYWRNLKQAINAHELNKYITARTEYVPDHEVEMYFKCADVLVLPYKFIYQSGVLFLSYSFGLPVIASDVGSLREDIIEGKTGFICNPNDPDDLAEKIDVYFNSDLFRSLEKYRTEIIRYANEKHSWTTVAEKTYAVYRNLLGSSA